MHSLRSRHVVVAKGGRARKLATVKDALMIASLISSVSTVVLGRRRLRTFKLLAKLGIAAVTAILRRRSASRGRS